MFADPDLLAWVAQELLAEKKRQAEESRASEGNAARNEAAGIRRRFTLDDLKGPMGPDVLTYLALRLGRDEMLELISRDYGLRPDQRTILDSLTPEERTIVQDAEIYLDCFSAEEEGVELCPQCGRVLALETGSMWRCSGASYENTRVVYNSSQPMALLSERIRPISEWEREYWIRDCGGSTRVYLPKRQVKRHDFLSLIPEQLVMALTFDELASRMKALYKEASYSLLNSTVRPRHLREALDTLREQELVRVLVGNDGIARFQRMQCVGIRS